MERLGTRVAHFIVQALRDQHAVCDAEVYSDRNDHGHEPGQQAAREVCDIADEPDKDEQKRYGFCIAVAIVLN